MLRSKFKPEHDASLLRRYPLSTLWVTGALLASGLLELLSRTAG